VAGGEEEDGGDAAVYSPRNYFHVPNYFHNNETVVPGLRQCDFNFRSEIEELI
jgi:hypothetical protein